MSPLTQSGSNQWNITSPIGRPIKENPVRERQSRRSSLPRRWGVSRSRALVNGTRQRAMTTTSWGG